MKKWPELVTADPMFDEEVQSSKDILRIQTTSWARLFRMSSFKTRVLKENFEWDGRVISRRGPLKESVPQDSRASDKDRHLRVKMVVSWVRVKSTVSTEQFDSFFMTLHDKWQEE